MKTLKLVAVVFFVLSSMSLLSQDIVKKLEFEVQIFGKGQPILLFPGFACTSEVFESVIPELSKSHEVHAFSFAGFGTVPAIETPWFSKIKDTVENYVISKNLGNSIIIGHSMGGTLALWLSSENPDLFTQLLIVDGLPAMGALMIPNFNSDHIGYDSPYNDQMLDMSNEDFTHMAKMMSSAMCKSEIHQAKIQGWMEQSDRKTYVYGYTDLLKLDLRTALSNIKIPVTILGATQPFGKEIAEKNYREQYSNLSSFELIFAENSGHFIMYDGPEWFLDQIKINLLEE